MSRREEFHLGSVSHHHLLDQANTFSSMMLHTAKEARLQSLGRDSKKASADSHHAMQEYAFVKSSYNPKKQKSAYGTPVKSWSMEHRN